MRILTIFFTLIILTACDGSSNDANAPIKIGDISSYTGVGAYLGVEYKKGWQMGLAEINGQGGVQVGGKRRPLEVLSRDSRSNPSDAVMVAQELIHRDDVVALMGPIFSHVGLAVSQVAKAEQLPLITAITGTDKLLWEGFHPYIFRVHLGSTETAAYIAAHPEAKTARKWGVIAANYEAGHSYFAGFWEFIKKINPDAEIIVEQYPALGRIEAGTVVQALRQTKPDAVFVFLLGGDLTSFVREYNKRGMKNTLFFNPDIGFPEERLRFGSELPVGWHAIGLPDTEKAGSAYRIFYNQYQQKYNEVPSRPVVIGYLALKSIAAGLEKAGVAERQALADALPGKHFPFFYDKPFGFREVDHQANFALAIGKTAVMDGNPTFIPTAHPDPNSLQLSDAEIKQRQQADN